MLLVDPFRVSLGHTTDNFIPENIQPPSSPGVYLDWVNSCVRLWVYCLRRVKENDTNYLIIICDGVFPKDWMTHSIRFSCKFYSPWDVRFRSSHSTRYSLVQDPKYLKRCCILPQQQEDSQIWATNCHVLCFSDFIFFLMVPIGWTTTLSSQRTGRAADQHKDTPPLQISIQMEFSKVVVAIYVGTYLNVTASSVSCCHYFSEFLY